MTVLGFLASKPSFVAGAIIESMPSLAIGSGGGRAAMGTFGAASGRLAPAATRQPAAPGAGQVAQDETLRRAKSSSLTDVPAAPENGASAVLTGLEGIRAPGQTQTEATTSPTATAEQPAKPAPAPAPLSKAADKATYRNGPTVDEALKLLETQEPKRKVLHAFTVHYDRAMAKIGGVEARP